MVKLREIPRTATFAWAPSVEDPMLVTGTKAGAIDADFDSTTQLEFWDLNLTDRSADASKLDDSKVRIEIKDSRFYDIAWGGQSDSKPKGVVAGGHESGVLNIWDAQSVLDGKTDTMFSDNKQHSGAIKALQFNPIQSHLLATAGSKGEYFVWDLNKLNSPYAPGSKSSKLDDIDTVAWNKHVSHIIATGGNTGFTSVYDLKNKREVMHLHYRGENGLCKVSSVTWAPNTSTSLITASSDDTKPVILLWDLRNANAPVHTMHGHERGVLSVDWCSNDEGLLLSSGMDNRTILWNPLTGDKLGEYPIATNWSFKSAFNNAAPDLFATSSFDGKLTVQTLQDTSTPEEAMKKPEGDAFWDPAAYVDTQHPTFNLQQPPRWLKRPVTAHFGFGGKLVKVSTKNGESNVSLSTFVGDEGISEDTAKFAEDLKSGNLNELATKKLEGAKNDAEKYDWEIISALLGKGSKKEKLAKFFASSEVKVTSDKAEKEEKDADEKESSEKDDTKKDDPFAESTDDFLGDLGVPEQEKYTPSGTFSLFSSAQNDAEKEITRAVLQGQFETAVDICLKEDRMTDAFMLALNGSAAIKAKVRNAYVSKNASSRPFVRLLNAVTSNDLEDVVLNANVSEWKEIISGLFTYVDDEKAFTKLCGQLGDRLLEARETATDKAELRNSAVLCYLAGTNLEKSAQIWLSELTVVEKESLDSSEASTPYAAHVKALHSFIEKVTMFRKASGSHDFGEENMDHLFDAYREYANIVASHGQLEMAEQYLDLLPSKYPGVSLEKERVQKATKKESAAATSTAASRRPGAASGAGRKAATHVRAESNAPAGQSSIYAPVQTSPATARSPYSKPAAKPYAPVAPSHVPAPAPPVPAPAAPIAAPASTIQPPANPYQPAANPYQPQPQFQAPGPAAGAAGTQPPPPPPPPKKQEGGWNDLPAGAVNSQPRRATPSNTIRSLFPNQPPMGSSTPPPPAGAKPGPGAVPPPPRAGSQPQQPPAPPKSASPIAPPPPSVSNRYAPQSPAAPQAPPLAAPQNNGSMPGFQPPPPMSQPPTNRSTSPQVNPYAPQQQPQQTAAPANNPYAPVSRPQQPQQPQQLGQGGGIGIAPPPPMQAASPMVAQSPPQPPQEKQEPTPPPAAPKHPPGDRSHIPDSSKPIFDTLSEELERVRPLIPAQYARQVKDADKRLNILFDHLNNEDLLDDDTVNDMVELSKAIQAKDYDTAYQIHVDVLTAKSEQCTQWMVGVKRLIEMGKATV